MAQEPKIKIVAVDNDETILAMYEIGLAACGYDIKTFASPDAANKYFSTLKAGEAPNVILMDIIMPGMDGVSLMHEIHSMDNTARVPIIAVSGLTDSATLNDALLFGAMDYLVKPFDMETLKAKILAALDASQKRIPKAN